MERERFVRKTFAKVASRYVWMNHLMTLGMDVWMRSEVAHLAAPAAQARVLDLGSGTGDLAREVRRRCPTAWIAAADFSLEMMRATENWTGIWRSAADALALPFSAEGFDIVTSGYLLRNVIDLDAALAEQYRVLKPGGRVVILDTTRPRKNLLTPLVNCYLHTVIPTLGRLFTGDCESYKYLSSSTENFITAEQLAAVAQRTGFTNVKFHIRMFGTMAIHTAIKPD